MINLLKKLFKKGKPPNNCTETTDDTKYDIDYINMKAEEEKSKHEYGEFRLLRALRGEEFIKAKLKGENNV